MDLGRILSGLRAPDHPDLLVGFDTSDDAGVFRIGDDLALVQTLDIITPVCDEPRLFGRIAATNALSDVYAMGGRPITAMNICCFPAEGVPAGVYEAILAGSHETVVGAGAVLVGGHTVRDAELKYGLSITGTVSPSRILRNAGARTGDALILSKPIGTGVLINAARKDRVPPGIFAQALDSMARLNDTASRSAQAHGATACTDITGFGLAGHALEMARASGARMRFHASAVPVYEGARALIEAGVTTAMTATNRTMAGDACAFGPGVDGITRTLFFDPQTSGGLLVAVPAEAADSLVTAMRAAGSGLAARVGEVTSEGEAFLEVV